ncbi:DUF2927 domain-containing protein [Nioella sp. MMSF_3534]|uniref:DUF2927 domain-containing protein n=1 Tax=Nioella sp. MMSF_3534 TaxID=3046720 RepID=UPI00273E5F43|nr:DUF2927 domain-containing protein [Nioella sp. MMSF_3534]
MILRLTFLAALIILPTMTVAQEFITVPRRLSDDAFYRLVACAAPPGGPCGKPEIRWAEERRVSLTVGIAQIDAGFPTYKLDLVDDAIDRAIAQINASGAYLVLERIYEGEADISLFLLDTEQGGIISGTGNAELDGSDLAIGRVAIRSIGGEIQEAAIAISRDIQRREVASVVLEELVQALGLPTDIQSPAYPDSIFNENSNAVVWLRGQDAMALRRHYPRL